MEDPKCRGRVDFEYVFFPYNKDKEPVLKDISFTCGPAETVGIIGSTGSEKSTLVNLISRFYDTLSGEIKVNGVNIKKLDIKSLREKIAVVAQKALLFSGTILGNIKWGSEKTSFEEIQASSIVAEVHEFIDKLP